LDWIESFRILQIEPTNDKKKIKIAYSKLLKKYNPEDFPDLFIKIQEAYETALKYSGNFSEHTRNFNENNFSRDKYKEKSDEYEKMKDNNVDNWISEVKKLSEMKKRKLEDWLQLFKEYNENMNSEEKKEIIKKLGIIYEKNDYIEISNFFFSNGETIYKIPDILTDLTEIERKFFMENIVLNKYRITSEIIENYTENIDKEKAVDNFIENFFEIKVFKIINQTLGLYDLKEEKKYNKIGIGRKLNISSFTNLKEKFIKISELHEVMYSKSQNKFLKIFNFIFCLSIYVAAFLAYINLDLISFCYAWVIITVAVVLLDCLFTKKTSGFDWAKLLSPIKNIIIIICIAIFFQNSIVNTQEEYRSLLITVMIIFSIFLVGKIIIARINYNKLKTMISEILDNFIKKDDSVWGF
jgi:curved-DNA-binding protein, dnaJ family